MRQYFASSGDDIFDIKNIIKMKKSSLAFVVGAIVVIGGGIWTMTHHSPAAAGTSP
jgi:hypothetical protein